MKLVPILRAASTAAALALVSGCGVAQRAGKGAAEGAVSTLARKVPEREEMLRLSERVTQRALQTALDEVSRPQRLDELQRIAAATAASTVLGASRAAAGVPAELDREDGAWGRGSPVEIIAEQAARAFSRQLIADLGPRGDGPLATSLSATTERAGRASLAAIAADVRGSLGVWPLVLAFGGGAFSAIVLAWAWAVYRRRAAPAR